MKPKNRHNSNDIQSSSISVSSSGITSLFLLLTTLVGSCEAQQADSSINTFIILPVTIVAIVVCLVFIFCACVCAIICCSANRSSQSRTVQYTHNAQRQRVQVAGGSYPAQSHQSSVPYPTSSTGYTSQTVPQAPEPVSLPEATLHQGDAPPGYEEAIRMKTVGNVITE